MCSRCKCYRFQSWTRFLPFKFKPVWHIANRWHHQMALLLASIVHHFRKYLEFFEFCMVPIILFEYIVWTFLIVDWIQIFSLSRVLLLFLFLYIEDEVLPETLRSKVCWHDSVRWTDALLLIFTWKSLKQCLLYLLFGLMINILLTGFRNMLELRIILTWTHFFSFFFELSGIRNIFLNIIFMIIHFRLLLWFKNNLRSFACTIILIDTMETFNGSGERIIFLLIAFPILPP